MNGRTAVRPALGRGWKAAPPPLSEQALADLGQRAGPSRRILILGSPGSGKTSLAKALHSVCGLPLIHLDDEHWGPGWQRPDDATWTAHQQRLVARESWIIDGNYLPSVPIRSARADLAVVLDTPVAVCLARVVIRSLRIRAGDRSALPVAVRAAGHGGVRATRDLPALLQKIAWFRRRDFWALLEAAGAGRTAAPHVVVLVQGPSRSKRIRLLSRELAGRGMTADVMDGAVGALPR